MKRQVEIFTANCPVCDPVVKLVEDLACKDCEVTVFDLIKQCEDQTCLDKIKSYHISRVPCVVVNGSLLPSCDQQKITKKDLLNAGIGQPS